MSGIFSGYIWETENIPKNISKGDLNIFPFQHNLKICVGEALKIIVVIKAVILLVFKSCLNI